MVKSEIEAHIFFRHSAQEIAALSKAVIPMREFILAVSTPNERQQMRYVLSCEYFRARSARTMVKVLQCASKYAKMHLSDFFPIMRAQILDDALALEEAATDYKAAFEELKNETTATH